MLDADRMGLATARNRLMTLVLSLVLLIGCSLPAAAQSAKCTSRINGLKPSTTMLVIGRNGQRFAGHLVAVDAETRILQLTSQSELGDYTREIPYDAIGEIRYAAPGRLHPMYAFWGLLLGAAGGFLIGENLDSGKEAADDTSGGALGAAIGAVGGTLLGAGVSLFVPSQQKIDCLQEPAPGEARD